MPRLRVFILTILCALVLASSAAAATSTFLYGVNSGAIDTPSTIAVNQLTQLPAANVTLFRSNAYWNQTQPTADGPYNWSYDDARITAFSDAGLTWLPLDAYDISWDESIPNDIFSAPVNDAPYADFAGAFAARYGPGGTFWAANPQVPYHPVRSIELWNEENSATYWHPQDSTAPARYYQLYMAAKAAIAAANPQVTAMFGGLADTYGTYPISWLQQLQAQIPGALANISELGWHPYLYSLSATDTELQNLRALLNSNGASNTPISITEVGDNTYVTNNNPTPWSQLLTGLVSQLPTSGCNVNMLLPYIWQDPGSGGAVNPQSWYTLALGDGTLTAPGVAYTTATAQPPTPAQPGTWCNPATPKPTVKTPTAPVKAPTPPVKAPPAAKAPKAPSPPVKHPDPKANAASPNVRAASFSLKGERVSISRGAKHRRRHRRHHRRRHHR